MKKIVLFLTITILASCSHFPDKMTHGIQTQQGSAWKIGAKIHFAEESGSNYIGLKEINRLTKDTLKTILHITKESGDSNAKILLTKTKEELQINHYTEKSRPNIGEELHATLLYTSPRGFHTSETLKQVCNVLFANCDTPPDIKDVSDRYSAIINPNWHCKISEIIIINNDKGPVFIMAKLLLNNHENIYWANKPISAGLHMTLVNCEDSSIFSDPTIVDRINKELNKQLQGKFIKIATKNGVADLEFGMSGQLWRIRAGKKIIL